MIGWREARRRREAQQSKPCGCSSEFIHSHGCTKFRRTPRLRIYRNASGGWHWYLDHGDGVGHGASAETWGEAVAVGLAALETASVQVTA